MMAMMALGMVGCGNTSQNNNIEPKTTVKTQVESNEVEEVAAGKTQESADMAGCDMAILDNGKLFFYDVQAKTMTPFEAETDSVVNCVFVDEKLYYCVPEKEMMVLKSIRLDDPAAQPVKEADWGLPYEKCVTETYGTVSPLSYYAGRHMLGLWHEFSWDSYSLSQQKLFNLDTHEITDWDWETWDQEEPAKTDEELTEENGTFEAMEDELKDYLKAENGNYWLVDGIEHDCLTDKIDFTKYVSDPDYYDGTDFEYVSSSPDNLKVLYMAIVEWGDYPHGVLCISSTDGAFQMPLEDTDCSEFRAEWLEDGSLVYVGLEPDDQGEFKKWENPVRCIKRVNPDGSTEKIAKGSEFQMR